MHAFYHFIARVRELLFIGISVGMAFHIRLFVAFFIISYLMMYSLHLLILVVSESLWRFLQFTVMTKQSYYLKMAQMIQ